jgi:hypothetical protein
MNGVFAFLIAIYIAMWGTTTLKTWLEFRVKYGAVAAVVWAVLLGAVWWLIFLVGVTTIILEEWKK